MDKQVTATNSDKTAHEYEEELRIAKAEKERFRLILDSLTSKVSLVDTDLKILWANKACIDFYGRNITGEKCYKVYYNSKKPCNTESCEILKAIEAKESKSEYTSLLNQEGHSAHVYCTTNMVLFDKENGHQAVVEIAGDMTDLRNTKNELRKSEEKYKLIAENTSDVIWLMKPNLEYIYTSPSVANFRGYSPEEHCKQSLDEVCTPSSVKKIKAAMKNAFSKGEQDSTNEVLEKLEIEYYHKNGSIVWGEVFAKLIMDTFGEPSLVLGVVRDISDRKRTEQMLRESEEMYRIIAENTSDVVWLMDMTLKIKYISPSILNYRGYTPQEHINHSFDEKYPAKTSSKMKAHIQKAFEYHTKINTNDKDRVWKLEMESYHKNGSMVWGEIFAKFTYDDEGNPSGIIGITRDITERKKAMTELVAAKEKAEESDRLKSVFLSNMSHEIRTPMNAIIGFTELLKESDIEPDERSKYLDIVIERSNYLLDIINDIIDLSKIEANQLRIVDTKISLSGFFNELEEFYIGNLIQKPELSLVIDCKKGCCSDEIFTDELRLKQIFINLINNAIKYSEKGIIAVCCELTEDGFIQFRVKDQGIGIPRNLHQAIFERFRQVEESSTREFAGTGLGLAITKRLLHLMGGEIWVESDIGKGSAFYFTIPYKTAP